MYTADHIFAWMLITGPLLTDHYIVAQAALNMDNVAFHGQCSQSSLYTENSKTANQCNCAINSNIGFTFVQGDCRHTGNCIHTGLSDSTPYWTVYLNQTFVIQKITVYGREIQVNSFYGLPRMRNVAVSVNQREVYRFPYPQTPDKVTDINAQVSGSALPMRGRDVTLSRSARLPNGTNIDFRDNILLNICEVQVWVCKVGHYGNGSACIPCRTECQNSVCDDIRYPDTCPDYDPCNSKPCANGGSCQRNTGDNPHSFTCHCPAGYTGWNCSTQINECKPDPCVNGACEDLVAGYNCICYEGYSGVNCSIEVMECDSNPCAHGGTCTNNVGYYNCTCAGGYTGRNCDIIQNAPGPIVGAFFGGAALMACVSLIGYCVWKRRTISSQKTPRDDREMANIVLFSQRPEDSSDNLSGGTTPVTLSPEEANSSDAYTVTVDNTYDILNPYGNDGTPEDFAYTGLRFT